MSAAALGAMKRRHAGGLGVVEQEAELDRAEHILVEHRAPVVDVRAPEVLRECPDSVERDLDPLRAAEHAEVLVHRVAELLLQGRHPPPRPTLPAEDLADPSL